MRVYIARMELVAAVDNGAVKHHGHLVDAFKQLCIAIDVIEAELPLIPQLRFGSLLIGAGFLSSVIAICFCVI